MSGSRGGGGGGQGVQNYNNFYIIDIYNKIYIYKSTRFMQIGPGNATITWHLEIETSELRQTKTHYEKEYK